MDGVAVIRQCRLPRDLKTNSWDVVHSWTEALTLSVRTELGLGAQWHCSCVRLQIITATTGLPLVGATFRGQCGGRGDRTARRRRLQSAHMRAAMLPPSERHACQWNPYGFSALVPVTVDDAADAGPRMFEIWAPLAHISTG
jgi:hypothetical protein